MKYKNQKEAIDKIARELGRTTGTMSLPKAFAGLKKEEYGRTIPKSIHLFNLLNSYKGNQKRFEVLQKVFSLHPNLGQVLVRELQPALNKLGFSYKNGVIVELKNKPKPTLKKLAKLTAAKYSRESSLISEAISTKGEKLSAAYFVIYLIENHLRLFIWKISGRSNRKLSKFLNEHEKGKITYRKRKESQNKWLALRKDSNLFYLDIGDLGSIIERNWVKFESYFPTDQWIITKIDEVAVIRNRIAHNNSFISDTEKKVLELYMEQIFNQIK